MVDGAVMLEVPRAILLVGMLAVASYHDVRSREIPDYVWIVGGGAGAAMYLLDWDGVGAYEALWAGAGAALAAAVWRLLPVGGADALAVLAISVVYPVSHGVVPNAPVVLLGGLVLGHLAAATYNVGFNLADVCTGRRPVFGGVRTGPWHARLMAAYCVHRRRARERFTFCAERVDGDGRRTLDLGTPSPDSEYETRVGVFVSWAMPVMPFMLAVFAVCAAYGAVVLG